MKILIDSREQLAYDFDGPQYEDVETERATLVTGDYSLQGLSDRIACERKSVDDLVGCFGKSRDRFERELARGAGLDRFAVFIEGSFDDLAHWRYRSKMKPSAVCQSVLAFSERYGVPFLFCGSRAGAQYAVCGYLRHYLKDARERLSAIVAAHDEDGVK